MTTTNYLNAIDANGKVEGTYADAGSFQLLEANLTIGKTGDTTLGHAGGYIGPIMGEVRAAGAIDVTGSNIFGVHGRAVLLGAVTTGTFPLAGVVAEADGRGAHAAMAALLTDAEAGAATAYGAVIRGYVGFGWASTVDYGLDLWPQAFDVYTEKTFTKAAARLDREVCIITGPAAPTNAVDGAGYAGPGSLFVNVANGKWYTNTNTKASPTWTLVGSQS